MRIWRVGRRIAEGRVSDPPTLARFLRHSLQAFGVTIPKPLLRFEAVGASWAVLVDAEAEDPPPGGDAAALWAELALWFVAAGVSVGWVLGVVVVAEEGLLGKRDSGLTSPAPPPPPCADSVAVSMGSIARCFSNVLRHSRSRSRPSMEHLLPYRATWHDLRQCTEVASAALSSGVTGWINCVRLGGECDKCVGGTMAMEGKRRRRNRTNACSGGDDAL